MRVAIGMRFLHSRWLDPTKMPERVPALFQVTGFKHGAIYYAPVYTYEGGREEVSKKRECCDVDKFGNVCKQVVDTATTNRLVSGHDMDTIKDGQKGRESQEHSKITSSQDQLAESFRVNQEEKRK